MELDDLKRQWKSMDAQLERHIRLNPQLLRAQALNRAQTRLRRMALWLWLEVALDVVLLLVIGSFLWDHKDNAWFLIPGAIVHVSLILLTVPGIRQLVGIAELQYSEPIVTIQKKLGTLRRERLCAWRSILLLAPLLWLPLLIVIFKGLLNVNLYAVFSLGWIAANLLLGVLWIALAGLVSRWLEGRFFKVHSFGRRLMRDIGGQDLNDATDALKSLEAFTQEEMA